MANTFRSELHGRKSGANSLPTYSYTLTSTFLSSQLLFLGLAVQENAAVISNPAKFNRITHRDEAC